MGRIADLWDEVKSYSDDLIVLFLLGYAVEKFVVPVLQELVTA